MPPVPNAGRKADKQRLHAKFSAAATALADLYRESSDSYEAGYRDALLFVLRYLQPSPAQTSALPGRPPTPAPTPSVNAAQMSRFLHDTIDARRERMAVVRGISSLRRRDRSDDEDAAVTERQERGGPSYHGDVVARDEDPVEGERGTVSAPGPIVPPSSVRGGAEPLRITAHGETADVVLSREMEHITHLEPQPSSAAGGGDALPHSPLRQRRRTDHLCRH